MAQHYPYALIMIEFVKNMKNTRQAKIKKHDREKMVLILTIFMGGTIVPPISDSFQDMDDRPYPDFLFDTKDNCHGWSQGCREKTF